MQADADDAAGDEHTDDTDQEKECKRQTPHRGLVLTLERDAGDGRLEESRVPRGGFDHQHHDHAAVDRELVHGTSRVANRLGGRGDGIVRHAHEESNPGATPGPGGPVGNRLQTHVG